MDNDNYVVLSKEDYEKLTRMPRGTTTIKYKTDNMLIVDYYSCTECKGKFDISPLISLKFCPCCGREVKKIEW